MSDLDETLSDVADEENEDILGEDVAEEQKVCHLTPETIGKSLSLLCKTGNGLGHAFVRLDLKDNGLSDISAISSFIHVRYLDLSNNRLTDLSPLASLTHLLWLKVENNAMVSIEEQPFAQLIYLQWLSMAGNQITDFTGPVMAVLENLNLNGNGLQTLNGLQGSCFANLVNLELRENNLETTDGINLPNLQRLYLAQNVIKHLEGLERLKRLTTLHLRDNQLVSLEGLSSNMKCLQYLNVRGNAIDMKNIHFLGSVSKTLKVLVIAENPLVENTDYRLSVLSVVPKLDRLDKDPVSKEEKTEALEKIKKLKEEEIQGQQDL